VRRAGAARRRAVACSLAQPGSLSYFLRNEAVKEPCYVRND
jgi:hypothetical protein